MLAKPGLHRVKGWEGLIGRQHVWLGVDAPFMHCMTCPISMLYFDVKGICFLVHII